MRFYKDLTFGEIEDFCDCTVVPVLEDGTEFDYPMGTNGWIRATHEDIIIDENGDFVGYAFELPHSVLRSMLVHGARIEGNELWVVIDTPPGFPKD